MLILRPRPEFTRQMTRIVREKALTISTNVTISECPRSRLLCHLGMSSDRKRLFLSQKINLSRQSLVSHSRRHSHNSSGQGAEHCFSKLRTRLGMLSLGAGMFVYVVNQYSSPAECAAAARSCFWWGRGNGTLPELLPEALTHLSFGPTHAAAVDGKGNALTWSLEGKNSSERQVVAVKGKSIVAVATGSTRTYALTSWVSLFLYSASVLHV